MAADLAISGAEAQKGETVTFALSVNKAPNTVKAFILDIQYDFTVLAYRGINRGALAEGGYSLFSANNISPGVIRIGGVEPVSPGIQKGSSGTLALLTFEVVGTSDAALQFIGLKDDISTWTTHNGVFSSVRAAEEAAETDDPKQDNAEPAPTSSDGAAIFSGGGGYYPYDAGPTLQDQSLQPETGLADDAYDNRPQYGNSFAGGLPLFPYGTGHSEARGAAPPQGTGLPGLQENMGRFGQSPGLTPAQPLKGQAKPNVVGINRHLSSGNETVTHLHIDNPGQQAMLILLTFSLVIQTAMLVILILIFIRLNAQAKSSRAAVPGAGRPAEGYAQSNSGIHNEPGIISLKKGV